MKQLLFFLVCLLLFSCKPKYDIVRKVDKQFRNPPPGTVWLKDSIFIDQTEVRNKDYMEYLFWLSKNDDKNYNTAWPDTNVWKNKDSYNAPYVEYYLLHPAYKDYPVVGVSYEQAINYCKWRTERVKEFARLHNKKHKTIFFNYRLPTKEEWEYAAYAGTGRSYGFESNLTKTNQPNFNVSEAAVLEYVADITSPVNSRTPNKFNLFNMIGNVAEMIEEKGISKGGSWLHSLDECKITDSIKYKKPEAWLGFRCVCVIR